MDERKTLDFNDLMEGGDQIPGFEVAKVSSANENTNSNDAVLHTPTHNEDEIAESNVENSVEDNTSIDNAKQTTSDAKTDGQQAESMNEDLDDNEKVGTTDDDVAEMNGETSYTVADDGDNSDVNDVMTIDDDKDTTETVDISEESNDKENDDSEPVKKKKKMYLQPPRPKMNLWGGSKQQTNHGDNKHTTNDVTEDDDDIVVELDVDETSKSSSRDVQELDDDPPTQNGETEERGDKDESENKPMEEEEDPHQQSFLSFLNLKPGSSKPQETEKNAEESKKEAFYSRKRLRTRKKVSYYEDVVLDDDEEYNVEDEEEDEDIEDHMMESTSRNRTNRARSRTNSKSPGKSQPASYTAALQNLLPGVDLTCLKQTPTQIAPATQRSGLPKIGPKSFMNRMAIANNSAMIKTNSSGVVGSTGKGLFECGLCGTFFNTASQFIAHQETMHGEKQIGRSAMETFRCEVCGFVLTNRFAYQEHKRMKHGNKNGPLIFNCTKCKVGKFFSLAALQKHQLACGAPFCSTCGATFSTWVAVAEHRRKAHTDPGQTRQWLNCVNKLCKFKCVTQAEMRQHVQQHHMLNEIFTCNAPKCSRVFTSRDDLTEHKKEAHASEFIVQYQCMECKNCFSSKTLLAEHQYLHTLEKLRKCDLCSRHFASIVELRKHKDVHAVKGSVRCQSCLRWCNDKLELVNHVCAQKRRTSGIRLYFCDVCHKDFRSDQKMFLHRKEHKNFFQCAICFWECTSESAYFEHRLTHGKHTCSECCEELDLSMIEFHKKAHKYYIKLEDMEDNGKNEKVMVLYPNLVNVIKA